ncbi:MAG: ribosome biogenesis GTPase Der [Patescibacteria group bacterium]|nr:ribosome biogenesis GTPase Der [Patescibacteria group bacterium]
MTLPKTRNLPLVAIVGRANVGKSTLWNRLTETGRAIVSSVPHTTRDRNYAPCLWRGKIFNVVDTGGMDVEKTEIGQGIKKQAELAIKEADLVLFLVDVQAGLLPQDVQFAKQAKKLNSKILLVANKTDRNALLGTAASGEFWKLGLDEPIPISAASGRGLGDLLDIMVEKLTKLGKPPIDSEKESELRIVIMGRPNVGKSSLMNAVLGEERAIVSPVAHTTREPLDTSFVWRGHPITLVDTAGMRKRARITERLEEEGVERNRQALSRADVAVLVVDATDDPRKQDKHLAEILQEAHRGLIIAVNKWDLVTDKNTKTAKTYEDLVRQSLPFLDWAPFVFISAKQGQRVRDILDIALKIRDERERIIEDNALDKFLKQAIARQRPRAAKGSETPYISSVIQTATNPPRFKMTVRGSKSAVHQAWLKFFERRIREKFGFEGTPIVFDIENDTRPVKQVPGQHKRKRPIGRRAGRY